MQVVADQAVSLSDGETRPLTEFKGDRLAALAGIGHPDRFFSTLRAAGLEPVCHPFPDHHPYSAGELQVFSGQTVLMTEKDGVKCEQFAQPGLWYVPAAARPDAGFQRAFESTIKRLTDG